MSNPLVAQPAQSDGLDHLTGLGIVEPAADAAAAVQRGDWLEAGVNVGAAGLDALGFIADPFGSLLSSAFAWFIENTNPLKEMLDALAGDPGTIHQNAATWGNVGDHLSKASDEMKRVVQADTAAWQGAAIAAYTPVAMLEAETIKAASVAAQGVGVALTGAGVAVAVVRATVRDLIATGMSELVQFLIRAAAAAVITVGLATPGIVADGIRIVVKWVNKVREWIDKIVSTIRSLSKLVSKFLDVLEKVKDVMSKASPKATTAAQVVKNTGVYGTNVDDGSYATR
ncbi:hypothetical protein SAMN05216553_106340 [Lentzea fradiae]|uniref:Proteins of 100 residues with WXG n=1 Tax=Lentzea fradiae TaxID=200378 RepID=A0A1G7SM50_9PSEU|nr:hypothetical protein [Lentzea fradiae]SDG24068.1 hypothetical protein SAMN05216553_106340 [Lentzea fradiae]